MTILVFERKKNDRNKNIRHNNIIYSCKSLKDYVPRMNEGSMEAHSMRCYCSLFLIGILKRIARFFFLSCYSKS